MHHEYENCMLCPRKCGADRTSGRGYCGATSETRVARIMLHEWEEPCISGTRGSGAVFFSGCNLRCSYCQNRSISFAVTGRAPTDRELADEFLSLAAKGAHNINLVTATPYLPAVISALADAKARGLDVPVVYNTGGYETEDAVRALAPLVDVWLPDFKYASSALAAKYSHAADYPETAFAAISLMVSLAGAPVFGADGMIKRGVIVRHLVLPGCREDSAEVVRRIASLGTDRVLLSLMRQYTPEFADESCDLKRRVTAFEYNSVLREAAALGLRGYSQSASSATSAYTPDFGSGLTQV